MINASKFYITNNFSQTIWSQNSTHLLSKIRDCIQLNEEYQRCFHVIKEKLASMPNERPFDFSEMYIFGKFDAFVRRCERIIEMFEMINVFSSLNESKIEGLTTFALKFNIILSSIKKKDLDFLDQRKQDVDVELDEFRRSINELNSNLNEFLDKQFNQIHSIERALALLKRYEKLSIPNIGLTEKYNRILQQYSKDLEIVAKIYHRNSKEPPVARNLPPITGKTMSTEILH